MSTLPFQTVVRTSKLDFDRLDDRAKKILLSKFGSFELSVRTRNVLINQGVQVLGDVIQIPENEWLQTPNCGTETICEIKSMVSQFNLTLGTEIQNWPAGELDASTVFETSIVDGIVIWSDVEIVPEKMYTSEIDFNTADTETRAWLVSNLDEFEFPVRAQNIFINLGLKTIADLIVCSEYDLLSVPNCGRKTVREIKSLLSQRGLSLNTKVLKWDSEAAANLQGELQRRRKTANEEFNKAEFGHVVAAAKTVEEELVAILAIETTDRNVQLSSKLWGWFGKKPRTLESVGNEYGLTRERVRQIAAKVSRKIKKRRLDTPVLIKAAMLIRKSCPAMAPTLRAKLREARLSSFGIHPLGLSIACEMLEIPLGLRVINLGGSRVYSVESIEIPFREFQRETRRRTSANGCVNFNALCDELGISSLNAEKLRSLISHTKEFKWLNDDHTWFYSTQPTRNRLLNLASKAFYACPKIRSNELRRAVVKSRRLEVKPPVEVLERLVQACGLATKEDGFLVAEPKSVDSPKSGSIEDIFVRILRDHGPVISTAEFLELCVQTGMNPISYYLYLSGSPVVSRLAKAVYSLVGAEVPPGMIEEIKSKSQASERFVDHGWDKKGRLWCATSLSRAVIAGGSIALPTFVADLVRGNWPITLSDETHAGEAKCKGNFLYPLRKALSYLGAEPGDFVFLEFDLHSRVMTTRIGGQELIDAAESGHLDQMTDD